MLTSPVLTLPLPATEHQRHTNSAKKFLEFTVGIQNTLLDYAWRLTYDKTRAEDLVQDSILKCYDAISRLGFKGEDFRLYIFSAIKFNYYKSGREKKKVSIDFDGEETHALSNHLQTGNSELCNDKVDALALAIDVYITSHYEPRHVAWWQFHLEGVTYEEIAFVDGVQRARICKVINKIKREVREKFRDQSLELMRD